MLHVYRIELRGDKFARTKIGSYPTWREADAALLKAQLEHGRQFESVITPTDFDESPFISPAAIGLSGYPMRPLNPYTPSVRAQIEAGDE